MASTFKEIALIVDHFRVDKRAKSVLYRQVCN